MYRLFIIIALKVVFAAFFNKNGTNFFLNLKTFLTRKLLLQNNIITQTAVSCFK